MSQVTGGELVVRGLKEEGVSSACPEARLALSSTPVLNTEFES